MSIGRNDPCPCGSGLKYKKCCIDKISPRPTIHDMSPPEINERIAYKGRVGRERKKWCEDYISWKTDQLEKLTVQQKQLEVMGGKSITCSKGCWFCCAQHVAAALQECDAIVYWLYLHKDVRDGFMTRYPTWRSRVRENESVFQQVNQAGNLSMSHKHDIAAFKDYMQKSDKYGQLNILCPFLDQGVCSIYPVRPFVCASYIVVSPTEHCKSSSTDSPIPLYGDSPAMHPPYFRGPEKDLTISAVPLLVYEIIHGGFIYLNDIPGFAGLESEAFNDPEIRALLFMT